MFERIRKAVLRFLRVPHEPDPPAGAPGSLLVFRAGRNYYKLRLLRWGVGQIAALAGIVFSLWLLEWAETQAELARGAPPPPAAKARAPADPGSANAATRPAPGKRPRADGEERARAAVRRLADRSPWWFFGLLRFFEWLGVLVYLVQIPLTYAMARLDYELRWYMVTDRSLRIRAGLTSVLESTMSFANVQQVVVSQGPLQRLLGLADVRVHSAGGGGDQHPRQAAGAESLHTGVFHGVENASQIRDLILQRLRLFRETGLGDPDDVQVKSTPSAAISKGPSASLAAARQLVDEARALRRAVGGL